MTYKNTQIIYHNIFYTLFFTFRLLVAIVIRRFSPYLRLIICYWLLSSYLTTQFLGVISPPTNSMYTFILLKEHTKILFKHINDLFNLYEVILVEEGMPKKQVRFDILTSKLFVRKDYLKLFYNLERLEYIVWQFDRVPLLKSEKSSILGFFTEIEVILNELSTSMLKYESYPRLQSKLCDINAELRLLKILVKELKQKI